MFTTLPNAPAEIALLGWTIVLLIVQLVLQAATSTLDKGVPYAMGNQDQPKAIANVHASRIRRAWYNLLETFPVFAALALALTVTNKGGGLAILGAQLYFWCRVAYVPVYVIGIPVVRTLVWTGSLVGIVLMLLRLMG